MQQTERRSQAPWVSDRSAWGRLRLTREMWEVLQPAVKMHIHAMWQLHNTIPNPSPESRESLDRIREMQKVLHNLEGLAEEKGWDLLEDQPV